MRVIGKIEELNQIIVSDPSYSKDVNCRYENTNINEKNWQTTIEINNVSEEIDGIQLNGIEFYILLNNPNQHCKLIEDGSFSYETRNKITEIDIRIDTACVSIGINNFADNIRKEVDEWQPDDALKTLSDGLFGSVKEGKENDKINFIWISGYFSDDTGYSIKDILDYITTQLQVKDLYQEIDSVRFPIINNDLDDINYDI